MFAFNVSSFVELYDKNVFPTPRARALAPDA